MVLHWLESFHSSLQWELLGEHRQTSGQKSEVKKIHKHFFWWMMSKERKTKKRTRHHNPWPTYTMSAFTVSCDSSIWHFGAGTTKPPRVFFNYRYRRRAVNNGISLICIRLGVSLSSSGALDDVWTSSCFAHFRIFFGSDGLLCKNWFLVTYTTSASSINHFQ
jgi:hypothetical protein